VTRGIGLLPALGVAIALSLAPTTGLNGTGPGTASAAPRVAAGRLSIVSIRYRARPTRVLVSLAARDETGFFVPRATVFGLVRRNGRPYVATRAVTGPAGRTTYGIPRPKLGGCLTTTVRRATAAGLVWDGKTPRNRICLPRPR
jgi:hypothetical protein